MEAQKGGDLYTIMMICVVVLQRTAQYCKTIFLQLKKKKRRPSWETSKQKGLGEDMGTERKKKVDIERTYLNIMYL